jgi:prepilin-type N-terminal cleavage/methylation domain-containing protein
MGTMQQQRQSRGFSLMELMIAMALGLIVIGSTVQLFQMGMKSTKLVSQRAEMQQDMRAAIELMTKDISQAGAGLPTGGIQLPNGNGATPSRFACDQTGACHIPNVFTYPTGNYMYWVIPGYQNGIEANAVIPSAPGTRSSSISVVYADFNFPLNEYNVTFPVGSNGTSVNIAPNPAYNPAPPLVTAAGGLQVGDLIWLSNSAGNAIGEVTGYTNGSIAFANADALNFNQDAGGITHNIASIAGVGSATANRIFVVSYYLNVPPAGQYPRLMRQVNGLAPVAVADNIINLQFAYDSYNTTGNANVLDPNQPNPLGVGDSINTLQKINISVMGQALSAAGDAQQNMALSTSVSARNMAFRNRYQ